MRGEYTARYIRAHRINWWGHLDMMVKEKTEEG
jgi:hypothetical protein